ncbi:MAG: heme exporter protein CcmB [Saprospiraceae bacterium]
MVRQIFSLLSKDVRAEWRSKQSINGIILYLFSTILVLYYSLVKVEKFLWTGVFWILLIFLSVNSLSGSFNKDKNRHWYYYTLAHPLAIYFSKLLYNVLMLSVMTMLSLFLLSTFFNIPIQDWWIFFITLVISILGISAIFTFISLLTSKANDQGTLMAILATPLIFPILMSGSRLSMISIGILQDSGFIKDITSIFAIDILAISLSIILFPILWRD